MSTWKHRGVEITLNGDGEFCCTAEGKFKAASSLPAAKKFIDDMIDKSAKAFPERTVIFTREIATEYPDEDLPPKAFVFKLTDFRMERLARTHKQWVATGTRLFPGIVKKDSYSRHASDTKTFNLEEEVFIDYTPEALAKLEELHFEALRLREVLDHAKKASLEANNAANKFRRPDGRMYPEWAGEIFTKRKG